MALAGRAFLYKYDNGMEILVRFEGADRLAWEAVAGPAAGQRGEEHIFAVEAAPNVHHVGWLEANSGTTVSQVLNLDTMHFTAFISYAVDGGREAHLGQGALEAR
ncbi:MAG: MoaF N-terminal domain-containing protein [Hyphomonadaceae bacterium]